MENINKIAELLIQYLEQVNQPMDFLDKLTAYILPIIGGLVLVLSALGGFIKYSRNKNIEIYEKILNEVYSPLYQYFIKQELVMYIHMEGRDYTETPIIEMPTIRTTTTHRQNNGQATIERNEERTYTLNLGREEIIQIRDKLNFGLINKDLFSYLNMYEVLVYMENKYNTNTDNYLQATLIKVDVENKIRKAVFDGYEKCHKKLGLDKSTEKEMWTIKDDQIYFSVKKSDEEINAFREQLATNTHNA